MGRGLLIIVSGLFIVYGIIQQSLNERQKSITQFSANYAETAKAETIANTMAELAFAEINKHPQDQTAGEFGETNILDGTGSVSVNFVYPDPDNPFLTHKILTATGTFQGQTSKVIVTTRRRAFSRYSYFTNVEGNINFTTGDVLNGPVHTNGQITLNGDAVFNGEVTAAGGCDGCEDHDPQFNQGADFSAKEIDLPVEVPKLADAATSKGLRFEDDKVTVEFKSNGTADITQMQQTGTKWECQWRYYNGSCGDWDEVPTYSSITQNYDLQDSNFNGIISSKHKMEVLGTLNGDVTLHSEEDIEIMGDIRYNHLVNPPDEPDPKTEDFLGIVSEGHTIVDNDAHRHEGSQDLDIHASIMALKEVGNYTYKGSFYVEDFDRGSQRGQLNILGGLIQYKRGAVGTSGGTGYLKNYTYDERFLGRSPRGFPPSDIYDFVSWKSKY